MKEFKLTNAQDGTKAIKYCQKILPNAGTSFLHKMIRKKNITCNGKKMDGNDTLHTGDVIQFFFSDETFSKFAKTDVASETKTADKFVPKGLVFAKKGLVSDLILYEDKDVLLYNKPSGMLSQKAKPNDQSLNEYFLQHLLNTGALTDRDFIALKPSVCNRLDRNTSGIVICGKSHNGLRVMNQMIKDRELKKFYRCIVKGCFPDHLHMKGYLKKDDKSNMVTIADEPFPGASYIETQMHCLKSNGQYSLLEIHLITGKTHQIRAHLAHLGFPIIGDYKYGDYQLNESLKKQYGLTDQLLHAYRLEFPRDCGMLSNFNQKTVIAPLPQLFIDIAKGLKVY